MNAKSLIKPAILILSIAYISFFYFFRNVEVLVNGYYKDFSISEYHDLLESMPNTNDGMWKKEEYLSSRKYRFGELKLYDAEYYFHRALSWLALIYSGYWLFLGMS